LGALVVRLGAIQVDGQANVFERRGVVLGVVIGRSLEPASVEQVVVVGLLPQRLGVVGVELRQPGLVDRRVIELELCAGLVVRRIIEQRIVIRRFPIVGAQLDAER
jgi:hypothetical protein